MKTRRSSLVRGTRDLNERVFGGPVGRMVRYNDREPGASKYIGRRKQCGRRDEEEAVRASVC